MSTETLTDWLLRQVADDQAEALRVGILRRIDMGLDSAPAFYDPARVLAECEAKRQIVEHISGIYRLALGDVFSADSDTVLRLLALPYADRPGYLAEWAPR